MKRKLKNSQVESIKKLLVEEGTPIVDIAVKFNVSRITIYRELKKIGFRFRKGVKK